MLEIRFRRTDNSLTLTGWGLSAGAVLGVLLASGYLVSLPHTLAQDKVDQVIRQSLRYRSSTPRPLWAEVSISNPRIVTGRRSAAFAT